MRRLAQGIAPRLSQTSPVSNPEPIDPPQPTLMTTAEVAMLFRRTDRSIRNWVAAGLLSPRRVGRSVFFVRGEIEAFLGADASPSISATTEPADE
jgi:hypothetical protein